VDLGLPGVLPVLNEQAVRHGRTVWAWRCMQISPKVSVFDRKNYFYPDLPKGYQTSQMYHPIVGPGEVEITLEDGSTKRIRIQPCSPRRGCRQVTGTKISWHDRHRLEPGRHAAAEIVSEPDMRSAKEAQRTLRRFTPS
jgi:aspartyl-tRNA(Asn)/glutamyl-tRNA(Gln) amidotransferase subunit B